MPLRRFVCPDGGQVKVSECLEKCRLGERCLTRTTLVVIGKDRVWDGVPHVTSLLNGNMLEYLKVTCDYAVKPKGNAFALLGSSHHKLLESIQVIEGVWDNNSGVAGKLLDKYGYVTELHLNVGWMQGTLDLVENENGVVMMTDHKTWGSNRLARNLPSGSVFNPRHMSDLFEVGLQMNAYRVMLAEQHKIRVDKMQVQCTVRDGGLAMATKRGVKENMYLIPVGKLPDEAVLAYFKSKASMLTTALKLHNPEPCTPSEHWNLARCRGFCDVKQYCPTGVQL